MTDRPTLLLVFSPDAALREQLFDRLQQAGYRVDAVGDLEAVRKRVAKDDYRLLISTTCELPPDLGKSSVFTVGPADLAPAGQLEARLAVELGGSTTDSPGAQQSPGGRQVNP